MSRRQLFFFAVNLLSGSIKTPISLTHYAKYDIQGRGRDREVKGHGEGTSLNKLNNIPKLRSSQRGDR